MERRGEIFERTNNVGLISGDLPSWLLDQIDLVVISPGVPTNTIPARYVDRKDGEVIGEVELAYRFMKGRIVGITGSNGKTTTTTLIGELLKIAGSKPRWVETSERLFSAWRTRRPIDTWTGCESCRASNSRR
jgi:UDP-N-acetylmuramoylalanine-D-glutamate ligase